MSLFKQNFIDPETGEKVSVIHKWIFHSRTMWLNLCGIVAEILTKQELFALPFYTEFVKTHPNTGLYIAATVGILNMVLRIGGNPPITLWRNTNGQ